MEGQDERGTGSGWFRACWRWVAGVRDWVGGWRTGTFLLVVYLLALAPRLAFVLVAGHAPPGVDEAEYDLIATSLLQGKGFQLLEHATAFRPPGYPWFLAGVYAMLGHTVFGARVLQSFIAAAHALLTYLVCRKAFGEKAARLSAVFVALYVPLIFYAVALMTENLFIPLALLAFFFLMKIQGERPWRYRVLAGVTLGAAILVRPSFTYFLPWLFFWFWLPRRQWKPALASFATIVLIVAVMVTPWCIRNQRVTGQFVYLDTRAGYNLYIGYHEEADGSFSMAAATELFNRLMEHAQRGETKSDVFMHNWGKEQALAFIKAHPVRALALMPLKCMHFWSLEQRMFIFAYSYNYIGAVPPLLLCALLLALVSPFAFLVIFSVIGVAFTKRWDKRLVLILLLILYYTALHSVVFGEARLHFPLVPFLAMLAAYGLVSLGGIRADWGSEDASVRQRMRRRGIVALVVVGLFVGTWAYGIAYSYPKLQQVLAPGGNRAYLPY